jgi:hypothetical protein
VWIYDFPFPLNYLTIREDQGNLIQGTMNSEMSKELTSPLPQVPVKKSYQREILSAARDTSGFNIRQAYR